MKKLFVIFFVSIIASYFIFGLVAYYLVVATVTKEIVGVKNSITKHEKILDRNGLYIAE